MYIFLHEKKREETYFFEFLNVSFICDSLGEKNKTKTKQTCIIFIA